MRHTSIINHRSSIGPTTVVSYINAYRPVRIAHRTLSGGIIHQMTPADVAHRGKVINQEPPTGIPPIPGVSKTNRSRFDFADAWDRKSSQGRSGASRQHIPDDASPPPMPSLKSSVPATEGLAAAVTALAGGLAAGLSLGSAGAAVPHLLSPLEVRSPAPLARLLLCLRTARGARRGTRVACTMRLARVRSVTGRPMYRWPTAPLQPRLCWCRKQRA